MTFDDLPWFKGFGGVMKAEFELAGRRWTVLLCDDHTYTMYIYGSDKEWFRENLDESEINLILGALSAV